MAYIVGLTGGIGCGKSAASDFFSRHGIDIIDADLIARAVVEPGTPALQTIIDRYGKKILSDSGDLDRGILRQIVFEDANEKRWLESLLHPLINEKIREKILDASKHSHSDYTILSAPLLLENHLDELVDRVLVIDCDEALQLQRAMKRDKSNQQTVKKIIRQQIAREQRLEKADDVIINNGSLNELYKKLNTYHQQLTNHLHEHS